MSPSVANPRQQKRIGGRQGRPLNQQLIAKHLAPRAQERKLGTWRGEPKKQQLSGRSQKRRASASEQRLKLPEAIADRKVAHADQKRRRGGRRGTAIDQRPIAKHMLLSNKL